MKEAYYLLDLLFAENTHNATSLLLVAVLVHTHCSSMREKTSSINQYFSNPISAECFDRSIFWRYFHYWSLSQSEKGAEFEYLAKGNCIMYKRQKEEYAFTGIWLDLIFSWCSNVFQKFSPLPSFAQTKLYLFLIQ